MAAALVRWAGPREVSLRDERDRVFFPFPGLALSSQRWLRRRPRQALGSIVSTIRILGPGTEHLPRPWVSKPCILYR